MLVVSDGALIDLANLVEGAVGEVDPVVADHKPAIRVVENGDVLTDRRLGRLARLQNEDHLVVLQGQRLRETALFFPGKRVVQIVAGVQWPMQILPIRRRLGEARIVIGHERRQHGVSFAEGADPGEPQLLDEPVLQGLVGPLDPAFRLARIGADDVDVQSV